MTNRIDAAAAVLETAKPCLIISGPETYREVELQLGKTYRIGRLASCEIVLQDRLISRKQAMIQSSEAGEFFLVDLGSSNGTLLNGTRLTAPAPLTDGDHIKVGEHHLTVRGLVRPAGTLDDCTTGTQVMFARRLVSVLVADVQGYTRLSRQTDPELLAVAIGAWFRSAGHLLPQHGSWSVKYIGDSVMAVWIHGDESEQPHEVLRMFDAAVQFAQSTAALAEQFRPIPFRVGIGINTGIAIVGNAGTPMYTDYTALGDGVNAAFRMEASTREIGLQFAIGLTTIEMVERYCPVADFLSRHTLMMKGYDEPTTVWAASLDSLAGLAAALRPKIMQGGPTEASSSI
jgi:adenylate cyclase